MYYGLGGMLLVVPRRVTGQVTQAWVAVGHIFSVGIRYVRDCRLQKWVPFARPGHCTRLGGSARLGEFVMSEQAGRIVGGVVERGGELVGPPPERTGLLQISLCMVYARAGSQPFPPAT